MGIVAISLERRLEDDAPASSSILASGRAFRNYIAPGKSGGYIKIDAGG
jgi:hypothetical protein